MAPEGRETQSVPRIVFKKSSADEICKYGSNYVAPGEIKKLSDYPVDEPLLVLGANPCFTVISPILGTDSDVFVMHSQADNLTDEQKKNNFVLSWRCLQLQPLPFV